MRVGAVLLVSVDEQLYDLVRLTRLHTDAKINTFIERVNQDLLLKERKLTCRGRRRLSFALGVDVRKSKEQQNVPRVVPSEGHLQEQKYGLLKALSILSQF